MRKLLTPLALLFTLAAAAQTPQQWRDSLAVLNKRIAQLPASTDLRLKKAAVNIELNQWEYAVEEYGRVLDIDAQSLPALFFRAFANNHLHHYDLARADYEHFLRLMPRHFDAQLGLAMTKRKMGRSGEVMDDLNRLVEMFPDSALAYASRADFEREQGQLELALYDFDEALRLQPSNVEFLLSKYAVLWALRRYDEARRLQGDLLRLGVPRSTIAQLQDSPKQ